MMKKGGIFALIATGAAVAGAAWYLTKKKKEQAENSVLYSEEFDEATEALDSTVDSETEAQDQ